MRISSVLSLAPMLVIPGYSDGPQQVIKTSSWHSLCGLYYKSFTIVRYASVCSILYDRNL
jgi:hypothetical protein